LEKFNETELLTLKNLSYPAVSDALLEIMILKVKEKQIKPDVNESSNQVTPEKKRKHTDQIPNDEVKTIKKLQNGT
jgi:hypothetical protein